MKSFHSRVLGLDGLAWETLARIADADPGTSQFVTVLEIEGWPVVHPWYDFAWKLLFDFKHTYKSTRKDKYSIDPVASEQAHHRLVAFTEQDFGSDIKAWTTWLHTTYRQSKWQWVTLLRDGT